MTFLTVEDYERNSLGGPTSRTDRSLTEPEIAHEIETATGLINAYKFGQLLYHTVQDELVKIRLDATDGSLVLRLNHKPIRVVQNASFVLGMFASGRYGPGFTPTPVEAVQPPIVQGSFVVNRNSNIVRIYNPTMSYNPGVAMAYGMARLAVTYTAGYDDGTPQADGVQLPAPDWLQLATRLTVRSLLAQRKRSLAGRLLRGTYRVGNISETYGTDADADLPNTVKVILDANHQNYSMAPGGG